MAHEPTELVVYTRPEVPATHTKSTHVTDDPPVIEGRIVERKERKRRASKKGLRCFRLLRVKWRAFKRSLTWRQMRVNLKLAWNEFKRSRVMRNKRTMVGTILAILSFIGLWLLVDRGLRKAAALTALPTFSFSLKYLWWGLAVLAVVAVITLITRMKWWKPIGGGLKTTWVWTGPSLRPLFWLAVVILALVYVPGYFMDWIGSLNKPKDCECMMKVTHVESAEIQIPVGKFAIHFPTVDVDYDVLVPQPLNGKLKAYHMKAGERNVCITDSASYYKLQLPATTKVPEVMFQIGWKDLNDDDCGREIKAAASPKRQAEKEPETKKAPEAPADPPRTKPHILLEPRATIPAGFRM